MITIETGRMIIRELQPDDFSQEYLSWLRDPFVNAYLETRHLEQSEESIVEFVSAVRAKSNEFLFGMFLKADGVHIGNVKIGPIHPIHRLADVSLLVGSRPHWGLGYATEGIKAVSQLAFDRLDVRKLSASMYEPNVGSDRAFLKAGYRREGLRRDHYDLNGTRCDLIELGLIPADIESLHRR